MYEVEFKRGEVLLINSLPVWLRNYLFDDCGQLLTKFYHIFDIRLPDPLDQYTLPVVVKDVVFENSGYFVITTFHKVN